ncbi:MAG: hypothetical protein ACRD4R_11085 [Candidatus Acidiferrales bacterium]
MPHFHLGLLALYLQPHFNFPQDPVTNEEIVLRWVHIVAGIIWIGLLYFFNLVGTPTMQQMEAPVRAKVFPALMSRAMWWFRWSALITVIAGLRYFWIILAADARNAGDPALAWHWFGWWLLVWILAFALIYPFQLPSRGFLDNAWVRTVSITVIVFVASWDVLVINSGPSSSNAHLSISVGGGLGLLLLFNAWGIVWRAQKRLIGWTRAFVENGTPMPAEAARLARWSFIASRVGFWLSFPMIFFMAAAAHYPFLGGIST